MASSLSTEKLFANANLTMHDVDADYTTAAVVTATVKDMRDYGGYALLVMTSALTGTGITLVEIVASSDSAGTADLAVIKTSGAVVGDAIGDFVALECIASEIRQAGVDNGTTLRYAGLRLTMQNAGDEAVATVVRFAPRHAQTGLTATTIA